MTSLFDWCAAYDQRSDERLNDKQTNGEMKGKLKR